MTATPYFIHGHPALDLRVDGKVTRLRSELQPSGRVSLKASITAGLLSLTVNDAEPITKNSPGLITVQPKDELSIGEDTDSAAGDYPNGNAFNGTVVTHKVEPTKTDAKTK